MSVCKVLVPELSLFCIFLIRIYHDCTVSPSEFSVNFVALLALSTYCETLTVETSIFFLRHFQSSHALIYPCSLEYKRSNQTCCHHSLVLLCLQLMGIHCLLCLNDTYRIQILIVVSPRIFIVHNI